MNASETNRTEHYLTQIMKNQNQWLKINKLKRQVESRDNTKERQQLMLQIESALRLMSIEFEKQGSFKIRVIDKPKVLFNVDFAKAKSDQDMQWWHSIATGRQSGKSFLYNYFQQLP